MPNRVRSDYSRTELLHNLAYALDNADFNAMSDQDLLALTVFLGGRSTQPISSTPRGRLHIVV